MTNILAHGPNLRFTHLPPEPQDFVTHGLGWYYLDDSTRDEPLTHDALTRFGQPIACSIIDPGLIFVSYGYENLCIREHAQIIRDHEHFVVLNETDITFDQNISVGWDTASDQRFSALAEGFPTHQPALDSPRIPTTHDLDAHYWTMEAITAVNVGFGKAETEAANFFVGSPSALYITPEGLVLDPTGTPLQGTETFVQPFTPDWAFTEDSEPTPSSIEANYQERINQLEIIAEDEEIVVSAESCRDFWHFIRNYRPSPQAGLILTDEGNLVAIWRETNRGTVEVEFLGGQQCKLIVFKDPKNPQRVLPEISSDTLVSIGTYVEGLLFLPADQAKAAPFGVDDDDTGMAAGDETTTAEPDPPDLPATVEEGIRRLRASGLMGFAERLEGLQREIEDDPDESPISLESLAQFSNFVGTQDLPGFPSVWVDPYGNVGLEWRIPDPERLGGVPAPLGYDDDDLWGHGDGILAMIFLPNETVKLAGTSGPVGRGVERRTLSDTVSTNSATEAAEAFLRRMGDA